MVGEDLALLHSPLLLPLLPSSQQLYPIFSKVNNGIDISVFLQNPSNPLLFLFWKCLFSWSYNYFTFYILRQFFPIRLFICQLIFFCSSISMVYHFIVVLPGDPFSKHSPFFTYNLDCSPPKPWHCVTLFNRGPDGKGIGARLSRGWIVTIESSDFIKLLENHK